VIDGGEFLSFLGRAAFFAFVFIAPWIAFFCVLVERWEADVEFDCDSRGTG